ncbi:MAG: hypothetical protein KGL93_09855 [Gemmatimonadota bacterium]|nr:hypothetical protein [Gemmatimonadota bacterium]
MYWRLHICFGQSGEGAVCTGQQWLAWAVRHRPWWNIQLQRRQFMGRDRLLRIGMACAGIFMLVALASPAGAQNLDSLKRSYIIPNLPANATFVAANVARSAPGSSSGSPSAFGASMGQAFVGASYQNRERGNNVNDGAVVAGFGLGNPEQYVGLEVAFTSYSTVRSGFGKTGAVSFKVHRVLPDQWGVAVGYENAATWGPNDGGNTWYGVVSKIQNLTNDPTGLFGSVTLNAGIGDGRFRDFHNTTLSTGQVVIGQPSSNVGFFASGGLRLAPSTSFIADWGGQDLAVGLSIAPFASVPLVFTPAMADVLERANNVPRFILGVGLGFQLPNMGQ